jgi:hypothetical protein
MSAARTRNDVLRDEDVVDASPVRLIARNEHWNCVAVLLKVLARPTVRGARTAGIDHKEKVMKIVHASLAALVLLITGCAHQVTFDRPAPYSISASRQNVGVTAVIDQPTLANKVPVRAFMTGIAHSWEVEPGDMLKQVIDIELPQMFAQYDFANTYKEPSAANWVILELAIPSYQFDDFRAKVSVSAILYESGKRQLLKKTYSAEGESQGAKMFWGGAFGMKSAIRQSSLDAYKKVFAELRADLIPALQSKSVPKNTEALIPQSPSVASPSSAAAVAASPAPSAAPARLDGGRSVQPQMVCEGSICEMQR